MNDFLCYINLSYCCGGIIVNNNNIIIESAPIFGWMINKSLNDIIKWINKKNGLIKIIKCSLYPCVLVKNGYVKESVEDTKLFSCIPEMNDGCVWGFV